jgi:tRNA-2-methylthio-N6-dimethylallyladenosine synthase
MNVADSAKLAAVLESVGYLPTPNSELADLLLINTCVVRQNAEDRAAWYITSAKGLKKNNPNLKIGLCGCLVTEPGRDLKQLFPHVDFFIPPNSPEKLAELLKPLTPYSSSPLLRGKRIGDGGNFVSIMTGCDNYCSYCVVPYVRGRETSRPLDEVLAEIKGLLEHGVTDLTLLGQNVNSYKYGLAELLQAIGSIYPLPPCPPQSVGRRRMGEGGDFPGQRVRAVIRFMTSHPKDMSDEIIETIASLPYVAKDIHLPLQSGNDDILKQMNRGYTVEYFKGRVAKIRSLLPNARISTDLMVGFPGETEAQFENSINLVKELGFTQVNMFAYSGRPTTAATKMPDQVPEEVKQARLQKLIGVVREMLL